MSSCEIARHRRMAVAIACCAGLAQGVVAGITVTPFPTAPTVQTFPDNEPPTDPPLPAGRQADHGAYPGHGEFTWTGSGQPPSVRVTDVTTTFNSTSIIRIPEGHYNADNPLADELYQHENGHHRIARYEYDRRAATKAAAALAALKAAKYESNEAATAGVLEALDNCAKSIDQQIKALGTAYDDLTIPKDDSVTPLTPTQAYDRLTTTRDTAPAAGTALSSPDTSRSIAAAGDPPTAEFLNGDLHFAGNLGIDYTSNPADPLRGNGTFKIGDMIPIGLNPNGTVLLSDTVFDIVSPSGGSLLRGALFEAAYGPSSLPGYAGMVQASLWVAPAELGGVEVSLGSQALAEFGLSGSANQLLTFWFFSNDPLFTASGDPAFGRSVATGGSIKIGYVVPSPTSAVTMGIAAVLVAGSGRRRRA